MNGAIVRVLLGQVIPAAAAAQPVDDGVECLALVDPLPAEPTRRIVLVENWLYCFPGFIRYVSDLSVHRCELQSLGHDVPPLESANVRAHARSVPSVVLPGDAIMAVRLRAGWGDGAPGSGQKTDRSGHDRESVTKL